MNKIRSCARKYSVKCGAICGLRMFISARTSGAAPFSVASMIIDCESRNASTSDFFIFYPFMSPDPNFSDVRMRYMYEGNSKNLPYPLQDKMRTSRTVCLPDFGRLPVMRIDNLRCTIAQGHVCNWCLVYRTDYNSFPFLFPFSFHFDKPKADIIFNWFVNILIGSISKYRFSSILFLHRPGLRHAPPYSGRK